VHGKNLNTLVVIQFLLQPVGDYSVMMVIFVREKNEIIIEMEK